jgi:hypothetical protein
MARNFLQLGNGKAKCQLCGDKIKTGIPQISHRAYQSSASFHANAKDCFPRSKAHIKKNGCPHCGVVDIDGFKKRKIYEGFECTHCYQPVSADKKTKYYNAEEYNVEFNEWADQEMNSHGKDISFKDWAQDEGMKHGNTEITEWAQHEDESHDARYGAETFEAREKKIGSIRIVKNPNFPSGTSLQAYIKTNRAELRKVFGNPNMGESGDGKSKGKEWNLVVGSHRVTIYDKREKGKKGTKYFNIGGSGKFGALLVAQALSIHRNERVYAKETIPQWLEDERRHQQVKSIDEHPDLTYERAKEYEDNRRRYRAETFEESFITTDMSPSYIDVVVTDDIGSSFEGRLYGTMKENHSGAKKGLVSYDPSTGNVIYYHKGMEFVGDVENSDMNYNAEGKKRSGILSDPFEEASLDSGGMNKVLLGIGLGIIGYFGYNKWK